MEEEIDLRPYIEVLLKRWYWIVGVTFLTAVVAYTISSFIPPTYEATALVAVIAPRDMVQLDPRIQELTESQPLRAFPQLAESDQILQSLLDQKAVDDIRTVEKLRSSLEAEAGNDLSVIQLKAMSQNPEDAARLANAWAEVFVEWTNGIYTNRGSNQVLVFEDQLAESEKVLSAADEALIAYQAVNRTQVLSNTLVVHLHTQAVYLDAQQQLNLLTQDTQRLREQLKGQTNSDPVTMADQLTALLLQLKAFNVNTAVPLQLQLTENIDLTIDNRTEQIALLNALLATLSAQADQINSELATLESRILELQQQVQTAVTGYNRLARDRAVAEETYMLLARKVEEERITSSDTTSGVRLASKAITPSEPISKHRLLNTIVASAITFTIAIAMILLMKWWEITKAPENE